MNTKLTSPYQVPSSVIRPTKFAPSPPDFVILLLWPVGLERLIAQARFLARTLLRLLAVHNNHPQDTINNTPNPPRYRRPAQTHEFYLCRYVRRTISIVFCHSRNAAGKIPVHALWISFWTCYPHEMNGFHTFYALLTFDQT